MPLELVADARRDAGSVLAPVPAPSCEARTGLEADMPERVSVGRAEKWARRGAARLDESKGCGDGVVVVVGEM